ncbi:OPT oligopeptide transporter protein-domain-containing protein [Lipomyces arxii]|uniref:OPT oligopeptide transporter protein-domain-containing protein n=1 Tax=Lipomyces arxii TaxID=56418 RepID=UPI0034CFD21B
MCSMLMLFQFMTMESIEEKKFDYISGKDDFDGIKTTTVNSSELSSDINEDFLITVEEKERIYEFLEHSPNLADLLDDDPDYMLEKMKGLTFEQAFEILQVSRKYYDDDANFPQPMMDRLTVLLSGEESSGMAHYYYDLEVRLQAAVMKFHSPYPEVRAVVRPTDDPTMPCETYRAYIIGLFWVCCGSFINQMFSQRQPSIYLGSAVLQILIYPSGKLFERLPHKSVSIFGRRWVINPGPWSFKEQMLATIMTNVGAGSTNFFYYALTMRLPIFFNKEWMHYGFMFLMAVNTQYFGFGLAGILRRYVVYPTKAVWPTILPTLQLNKTLLMPENKQSINGWTITKYRLFWTSFVCMFVYFFIPDYLFPALSTFNWITWIAPQNKVLAFVTGSRIGMGVNPWTSFDWSVINSTAPLVVPFFAAVNKYIGHCLAVITIIGLYWSNFMYTSYFPPNNSNVYDRYGQRYNVSRIITDGRFDVASYQSYSQIYIGAGNMTQLGGYYCMYTCAFTYIVLSERKMIISAFKGFYQSVKNRKASNYDMFDDPFSNSMRKYKEVPDWWFVATLILSFCIGVGAIVGYPTGCPVWAIVVVILVSIFLVIPSTIIFATTGYLIPGDTLTVIVGAYLVRGNPIASLLCRVFGYNNSDQAETFVGDQKLAHYARMPPRAVFRAQMIATLAGCFITTGAITWLIENTPDLCTFNQPSHFVCWLPNQLYSTTLLLGIIGPRRTYDVLYPVLKYAFLMGAVTGIGFFFLRGRYIRYLRQVHPVIIISGFTTFGAGYNLSYYTPGMYLSFIFMYYIRRHYLAWWTKYNYILSSGLSAGMAFSGILIFFALQYTNKTLVWWGSTVSQAGVDGQGVATLLDAPTEGFGPPIGSWD